MKPTKVVEKLKLKADIDMSNFPNTNIGELDTSQIDWTPLNGGGSNFRTHKLRTINEDLLVFKPTLGMQIFSWLFFLVGAMVLFFARDVLMESIVLALVGGVFTLAGLYFIGFSSRSIIFDEKEGTYKESGSWSSLIFRDPSHKVIPLEDIVAVQLIREYVRGDDNSYYSYEINLVLKDMERINVVDHGGGKVIHEDAAYIAQFLGVPLLT